MVVKLSNTNFKIRETKWKLTNRGIKSENYYEKRYNWNNL